MIPGGGKERIIMKYEIERMNPQVSVLMSVYNASETLCAAIESILNQTLAEF